MWFKPASIHGGYAVVPKQIGDQMRSTVIFAIAAGLFVTSCGSGGDPEAEGAAATASSPDGCPVQGVWELDSVTVDGVVQPADDGRSQIKLVTQSHWAFVAQLPGATQLVTVADSLAAYRTRDFGGGKYTVTDSSYTERLDYFSNPEYVGREVTFTCRIDGDRWHHGFDWTLLSAGRDTGSVHVEEVWRRIE